MGAEFIERAVDALHDRLATRLVANLRLVEIDVGIAPFDLPDPVVIIKARGPFDNRSPLIQVFDEDWAHSEPAHQRNDITEHSLGIVWTYLGTVDLEANELLGRRYMRAIRDAILEDTTLDDRVVSAFITEGSATATQEGDNSVIRQIRDMGVACEVHDP